MNRPHLVITYRTKISSLIRICTCNSAALVAYYLKYSQTISESFSTALSMAHQYRHYTLIRQATRDLLRERSRRRRERIIPPNGDLHLKIYGK
ncbi:hypothetical protein [Priestia megaterium]|uniref:hypothetical protein n=1 Tax=Priestia megaterium TaxID=1404 RepID=UPI00319DA8B4